MSDPTGHPDLADLDASRTGEATPEVEAQVQAHLRECAECRRALADLSDLAVALGAAVPAVPDAVDRRILWLARKEAVAIRRAEPRPRAVVGWRVAAVAAGVVLAVGLLRTTAPGPRASADVDGNGVVDVRDAFVIARALRAGAAPPSRLDVNGDHVVDGADVDLVARAAVALRAPS
jgi:predicted anti-sigma-YlaC factor YlaD